MPSRSFTFPVIRSCIVAASLAVGASALLTAQIAGPAFAEEPRPVPSVEAPSPETSPGSALTPDPTGLPEEPPTSEDESQVPPLPEEPPTEEVIGHLTVSPMQAYPGEKVRVTGQCKIWGHGPTDVWLGLYDVITGNSGGKFSKVDFDKSSGEFDTDVTLSSSSTPGEYRFGWMCSVDDQVFAGSDVDPIFTVLGSTTPPTKTPTPKLPDERGFNLIDPREHTDAGTPAELAETGNGGSLWILSLAAGLFVAVGACFVTSSSHRRRAVRDESAA